MVPKKPVPNRDRANTAYTRIKRSDLIRMRNFYSSSPETNSGSN